MRILVTGAQGFIGRALCAAAADAGYDIVAATRPVTGDIATFDGWSELLRGAEAAVHLAALAHSRALQVDALVRVNVEPTRRLGVAAAARGVPLVFLSTVKVHGDDSIAPVVETAPIDPRDPYAHSKSDAESALRAIPGLRLTILRPPLVYGPGVKANFLALVRAVDSGWPLPLASVRNRRSLIYVGNLVDAIVRCIEAPKAAGRTYLFSDGEPVSTPELIRALARALGRPARLLPFPPRLLELAGSLAGRSETVKRLTRSLEVDDGAIQRELGWRPPYTFEEGICLTAQWFREEGSKRSR